MTRLGEWIITNEAKEWLLSGNTPDFSKPQICGLRIKFPAHVELECDVVIGNRVWANLDLNHDAGSLDTITVVIPGMVEGSATSDHLNFELKAIVQGGQLDIPTPKRKRKWFSWLNG